MVFWQLTIDANDPVLLARFWGYSQFTVMPCLVNGFTPRVGRRW